MPRIGKCKVGREVPAAPELRVRDEFVKSIEQTKNPGTGLPATGQRVLIPCKILVGGTTDDCGNEAVLVSEVLVERPAGNLRLS
jgi:hypothetical protein